MSIQKLKFYPFLSCAFSFYSFYSIWTLNRHWTEYLLEYKPQEDVMPWTSSEKPKINKLSSTTCVMLESFPQATEYKFCELISVGLMLYLLLGLSLSTPVAMILQKWPKVTLGGTSRIKDEISFNIFLENFISQKLYLFLLLSMEEGLVEGEVHLQELSFQAHWLPPEFFLITFFSSLKVKCWVI